MPLRWGGKGMHEVVLSDVGRWSLCGARAAMRTQQMRNPRMMIHRRVLVESARRILMMGHGVLILVVPQFTRGFTRREENNLQKEDR